MAKWKQVEPVQTHSEMRVYNTETGEEGYARVAWVGPAHKPTLLAPVVRLERIMDEDGVEIEEPRRIVIDANPTF